MNTRLAEILGYIPNNLSGILRAVFEISGDGIQEIRLRCGRPLIIITHDPEDAELLGAEVIQLLSTR